jgi:hypothetical protein
MATYFKATFDDSRKVKVEYSDNEAPSKTWKKGLIIDEIIVRATGRTNWSQQHFKHNIEYEASDFSLHQKRKAPLLIQNIYLPDDPKGVVEDIIIPPHKTWKYVVRESVQETFDAIIAVDTLYTKFGGGMKTQEKPLHKNPDLQTKLWELLENIKHKR